MEDLVPDFLEEFLAAVYEAKIESVRMASAIPDTWDPIVISVVRDELHNMADFLRHYRALGIKRFVILDNGSGDGTREFLERADDVDLYEVEEAFSTIRKQAWIANLMMLYGYRRWYLIVDADEHVVFHGKGVQTFSDITSVMERRGIYRLRALLLDMYGEHPITQPVDTACTTLATLFPLFDKGPYVEERKPELVSVRGGVRRRVFNGFDPQFDPELAKYPLIKLVPGEYPVHPHYVWPYHRHDADQRYLAVLHYKFGPAFETKIADAIERGQYWSNSLEYRVYRRFLDGAAAPVLATGDSERYACSSQLVTLGLIGSIDADGR